MKKMIEKVFLSAPISSFEENTRYNEFREFILKLVVSLRHIGLEVYSEVELISSYDDFDSPTESVEVDFSMIRLSDIFLLVHPCKMQTSSLIELGYAYALNKKIIIIANKIDLPYMALGLEGIKIIDVAEMDESALTDIIDQTIEYIS